MTLGYSGYLFSLGFYDFSQSSGKCRLKLITDIEIPPLYRLERIKALYKRELAFFKINLHWNEVDNEQNHCKTLPALMVTLAHIGN